MQVMNGDTSFWPENCFICGALNFENHHITYRSQGGHEGQQIPVCPEHHRGTYSFHAERLAVQKLIPGERLEVTDTETSEVVPCWINDQWEMINNSDRAEMLDSQLRKVKSFVEQSFVAMAEGLYEIETDRLYKSLGCESMREYFETLGLTQSTGYRMLRVHKRLRLEAGLEPDELVEMGLHNADRISQFAVSDDPEKQQALPELVAVAKSEAPRSALNETIAEYNDREQAPQPIRRMQSFLTELKQDWYNAELVEKLIQEAEYYRREL